MAHYQKHLFFCTNIRKEGKICCGAAQNIALANYAKAELQARQLHGEGLYRVSTSGCLGRCRLGPALVIYPDAVWYRPQTPADIDTIIDQHLCGGQVVTELLIDAE